MKKRLLIIILIIVFMSFILLLFNWKSIKIMHFVFSEKDQLNKIVSLVREKPDEDIERIQLTIGKEEDYYWYWGDTYREIQCESNEMEKALNILKDFKKKYGKYELDFDSLSVFYQGDKIMIRTSLSVKPDKSYDLDDLVCSVYELIYIDNGYNLYDSYNDVKIHMINKNWGYYNKHGSIG